MLKQVDVVKNAWGAGVMIPSFNVAYLPMVEPIVEAVADQDSFALISTAQMEWETEESKGPGEVMEEFQKHDRPDHVRPHLDHVFSVHEATGEPVDYYSIIKGAIDMGYPSVMIDCSSERTIEASIEITQRIVDLAHARGVLVEAEVGQVFGYTMENMPPYEKILKDRIGFTTEQDARRIVEQTGCDWLSVAVGNLHGAIFGAERFQEKIETRLDVDHIARLNTAAGVPLVLHGGSSANIDDLRAAFKSGIAKINVAKDLRIRYREAMEDGNDVAAAQQVVYDRVTWLIRDHYKMCGTSGIVRSTDK